MRRFLLGTLVIGVAVITVQGAIFGVRPAVTQAATFNANTLIADAEFRNSGSMTESQIQSFLLSKNSMLADYKDSKGRSAAKIIYQAATGISSSDLWDDPDKPWRRNVSINPRVILVTLQKEMSLITGQLSDSTFSARMNIAMGYGCPDSGGCSDRYKGFFNQINYATWQLDWNYERAGLPAAQYPDYKVGQTKTFSDWNGKHTVKISNKASAALYRYTPHVYNGNYNFWNLYHQWFPYAFSAQPLTLIKESGGPVYILANNKKWLVADDSTLAAWGLNAANAQIKTTEQMGALATGTTVTALVKGSGSATYLVENGVKRPISGNIYSLTGITGDNIAQLDNTLIDGLPFGAPATNLLKLDGSATVYYLVKGTKYPLSGAGMVTKMGYNAVDVATVPASLADEFTTGASLNQILRGEASSTIYLLTKGKLQTFRSPSDISHWGFAVDTATVVPDNFVASISKGSALTRFIRSSTSSSIYLVEKGKKRKFVSGSAYSRMGYRTSNISTVPSGLISGLSSGYNLSYLMKKSGGNTTYLVFADKRYPLISNKYFDQMGLKKADLLVLPASKVDQYRQGSGISNLVKTKSSSRIYLITYGKKMYVSSDYFKQWRFSKKNIRTVTPGVLSSFPSGYSLTRLVKNSKGNIYLIESGKKRYITSTRAFNRHGYSQSKVRRVSDALISALPSGASVW